MHALLARQLKRLGLSVQELPVDLASWRELLQRVTDYYKETDNGYAMLERSVRISSTEMQELNERIRRHGEAELARERDKLSTVVEALSEGLLALDDELVIRVANRAALGLLRCEGRALVGRPLLSMIEAQGDMEGVRQAIQEARRAGTRYQSEALLMLRTDGSTFPVALAIDPIAQDETHAAVVLFRDLSAQHEAERAKLAQEAQLRRTHAAVLELARSRAIHAGELAHALEEIGEACADVLDTARVSVWWIDQSFGTLCCAELFERDGHRHSRGARLLASDYPAYFAALHEGSTIVADVAREDPRTREFRDGYLVPLDIHSMLDVPILVGDRLTGVLCIEHTEKPRAWSLEEQNFALLCANCVSLAYEAAERLSAQAGLENSRRFLDSVVENLPVMVFVKSADELRFVRLNKAGEELLGYPRDELLCKNDYDLFPKEQADAFVAKDREVLAASQTLEVQAEAIETRSRGQRLLHTRKIAIRNQHGEATHLLGISEDVTEQRVAAEALERAKEAAEQASLAKSRFIANMSHEIRTPMNAVLGLSELLIDSSLGETDHKRAKGIHQAAKALIRVINDVLDVSRLEASRVELIKSDFSPLELTKQVYDLLRPLADAKHLAFRVAQRGPLPLAAQGDEGRLRQVLINLVGNAIKFTASGSVEIEVEARMLEPPRFELSVAVTDTGPGIAPHKCADLFQAFSQVDGSHSREHGGTGLGLYIARELAKVMGGDVTLRSAPGEGSTFRVQVPLETRVQPRRESTAFPPEPTPSAIGARVLVAEDNALNQEVVRAMLEQAGYQVVLAADGMLALSAFADGEFDCILMDCQMPRMDGLEATRRIRALEMERSVRRTPIVALTASAMPDDRARFREAGMNAFLPKPFSRKQLMAVLAECRASLPPDADVLYLL